MRGDQLLILVGAVVGFGYLYDKAKALPTVPSGTNPATNTPINTACTMEARVCPDGSSVGRVGVNCAFAACPSDSGGGVLDYDNSDSGDSSISYWDNRNQGYDIIGSAWDFANWVASIPLGGGNDDRYRAGVISVDDLYRENN